MEQATDKIKRWKAAAAIATAIAIPAEGLRQYAYYDPPGILTVCYGSTTQVQKGKKYSLDECRERLDNDMLDAISAVDRCVPGLPDHVLAAFGDAVYNIGPRIACDTSRSTAARLLKAGKLSEACRELPKWNKANVGGRMVALPGLTTRRTAEMTVCLGDNHANP
jgi:GH24 family phage-related lysozyme (muramidase)